MTRDPITSVLSGPGFVRAVACAISLAALLLAGCGAGQLRKNAETAIHAGDYEAGIAALDKALAADPENALLRSGLIQSKSRAISELLSAADIHRMAGQLDAAMRSLERARRIDPGNPRASALMSQLDTQKRQTAALEQADQMLRAGRPQAALRLIDEALKDNTRHPGLSTLKRRIEIEQRQAAVTASKLTLAETRPISLDFRDAGLRTVLDVVSRNSGINFILDKDIRADVRVTVVLRQAKVEDALDLIVDTNQLAKKVLDPQTIVIYPNTPDKQREYQEQLVRVFYLASAEAKGAASFLRSMLKIREPFVDDRSNMLALRDTAESIQLAERLIALYDMGEPEVLLEVEVLEISESRLTELGVKFPDSFSLTPIAPAGGLTLGNIENLTRNQIAVGVAGLLLNLRREVGDYTTLANPRIRARNKEKAKILIGDKIPVVTTTTGVGGFVSDSVSYLDVGLKLDVEPTVYPDDEVAIKIALEVSTLGSAVKTSSGTLAYQIGTRNASTLLRLRDGETQLLAGLISKEDRTSASRIPGAGDLPVLGRLFSNQQDRYGRSELVLAITPRVLRNIRRPEANETELWVGTEANPRLKLLSAPVAQAAPSGPQLGSSGSTAAPAQPQLPGHAQSTQAAEAPAQVRLRLSADDSVASGQVAQITLNIDSAQSLRGMPLEFSFDAKKLQFVGAQEGDFFKRDGTETLFTHSVDSSSGIVRVGVLRKLATGASGVGAALSLQFKAVATGSAQVSLIAAQPASMQGAAPRVDPLPTLVLQVR